MEPSIAPARLELKGITKRYPSVVANDGVDLSIMPGEIHAILGENGAGKSTLMKIIYGVTRPDAGTLHWNGEAVHIANPAAARQLGIGMVFQHFSLFDTQTVAENISLACPGAIAWRSSNSESSARPPSRCSRPCGNWLPKAAAFFTSAISSMRSANCATTARACAAAG